VITTDPNGCVAFLNPAAEDLIGVRQVQAIGQPLEAIFRLSDQQPLRAPLEELAELDLVPEFSRARLMSFTGTSVAIETSRAPIRDADDTVHGSVVVFRDITERSRREEDMARRAYRDELTGLPNRTSLQDRLSLELAHARRNRESLALVFIDLDDFKTVNDSFGHAAGDELLRAIAARLRASLRECDTIARLGGDEFTVILPGIGGPRDAELVCDKLLEAIDAPVAFEGRAIRAHGSIGIAIFPHDGADAEQLLRRADEAMYRAKQRGGARRALFDSGFYRRELT
jgi:diguanylate cyclase (GGDEF)-like protein/PAS domain S-box-containing protein